MTSEEAIKNIKLLRLSATYINAKSFNNALDMAIEALSQHSFPSNLDEAAEEYEEEYGKYLYGLSTAFKAGAEWREQQIPKLPDNLDEAAEKIASDIAPMYPDIGWDECFEKIKDGIKAGAEWMAGQGCTKEAVIGMATKEISINVSLQTLNELDLCPGDKVVVQIRKK